MICEQIQNRNESLDAESVEFLRLLNLYRVENEGAAPGLIDNRELVRRLAEASNGPVLTLPTAFLDEFMSHWEESQPSRWRGTSSATRPGSCSGRRASPQHTTTEQRLRPGPARPLPRGVELPEQLHAPLRRIAEREAEDR